MKFRNADLGETYDTITVAINRYCGDNPECENCILSKNTGSMSCEQWAQQHIVRAAELMRLEIIEDEPEAAEQPEAALDIVNHPAHYTADGVECIDAIAAATVGLEGIRAVCVANIIKYVWRWNRKDCAQDLDKAEWYLKKLKQEVRKHEQG